MTNFRDLEREIQKNQEGFTYSDGFEEEKKFLIHSSFLKQSLRGLLSQWKGACEVRYDANQDTMEHKLESEGRFGIYREMPNSPDELVILDNLEKNSDFIPSSKDKKDKFFTLPRVERVTPVTPVEPVEKVTPVTPVTPVGSDDNYEGYHTVFSFQKDIKTGRKTFIKTTSRGNNEERERLMIERNNSLQSPLFMETEEEEYEAKQEQVPSHRPYQKR